MGLACSLARAVPVVGIFIGLYLDFLIAYALVIQRIGVKNGFITINWSQIGNWVINNILPKFLRGPVMMIKNLIPNPFKKKDGFVSHPIEYKKQLNNDGGIGWVPYYGKPGRKCEEDKDCPTFQKCNEDKCVIPLGVR